MHAADLLRVSAAGAKDKAEETLNNGASHQAVLQRRVDETDARLRQLLENKETRLVRVDELEAQLASDRVALKAKKDEQAVYLEENQGLEQERQELTDQRATLRVRNEERLNQAQNHRRLAEELMRTIADKEVEVQSMGQELIDADLSLSDLPDDLMNVGELERKLRGLQRKMEGFGNVNMMAIEQYDECQARLDLMKDEFATLQRRRKDLIEVTELLESQRKERLVNVLEKVNENFKKSYHQLSDGGRGELFLENPDEPFKGGLELWAQPRGKSSKVSRQQLSGGEQSMAALALIFAIQDYDPSPFYYFDEVDQNLDAYNAERIAKMCRERSKRAQFIMVTLRKVSFKLADHHIGITHGGDGCSRRILDFDRERAIALGEAALKEAQKDADKNESRIMDAVAAAQDMPEVPEPVDVPKSLGGLLAHMHDEAPSEASMGGLMERTQELTEDINERAEVAAKVAENEVAEEEVNDSTAAAADSRNSEVRAWQNSRACSTDGSCSRRSSINSSARVKIARTPSSSGVVSPPSPPPRKPSIRAFTTRSTAPVALVLSLVRDEAFNPWDVDLSAFLSVFAKRVKDGENLDLPACGRLIRLSWEVLHHQSAVLFDKIQPVEEEVWEDDVGFGWESDYDDEAFFFTQSVLDGDADEVLTSLFDERVRRDEGRPGDAWQNCSRPSRTPPTMPRR